MQSIENIINNKVDIYLKILKILKSKQLKYSEQKGGFAFNPNITETLYVEQNTTNVIHNKLKLLNSNNKLSLNDAFIQSYNRLHNNI